MKALSVVILFVLIALSVSSKAALPPHFTDCLKENSSTNLSVADLKEIAKVSPVTYCQNQVSVVGKLEIQDLLTSPNVQLGISVGKTAYSYTDFMDMARTRPYVLYVDSARLSRDNLVALSQAGVQLVIVSASAGFSKMDLMQLAAAKTFILNVNSPMSRTDLRDFVNAGVQLVIRTGQAGLSRADILEVAALNTALVSIVP